MQESPLPKGTLWIAAALASIGLWLLMPWGITISSGDSVDYLEGARHLSRGEGFVSSIPPDAPGPVTQFPPLYSLALAGVMKGGLDSMAAARLLNALCYGLSLFFLVRLVSLAVPENRWAPLAASVLFLANPVLPALYSTAFSEALFLALALAGQWALLRWARTPRWPGLVAAAVLLGLTAAARYAGVVWIVTGALFVFVAAPPGWLRRVANAAAFGAIAILPALLVSLRNHAVTGNVANRHLQWHPVSLAHLGGGLQTVAAWFLPSRLMDWRAGLLLALAGGSTGLLLASSRWPAARSQERRFLGLQGLFLTLYALQILAAISLISYDLALDERIMAPVQVAVLGLAAVIATSPGRRGGARLAVICLAFLPVLGGLRAAAWARANHTAGSGYRSRAWATAAFTKTLAGQPSEQLIYSNKPEAVFILTGHPVLAFPFKALPGGQAENPRAAEELEEMIAALRAQHGLVAYFQPPRWDPDFSADHSNVPLNRLHKYSDTELQARIRLSEVARSPDAVLYRAEE